MCVYVIPLDLVRIHKRLCEKTRLRIVNLLLQGPLCVCHLQEALREPQVKISRPAAEGRKLGTNLVQKSRIGPRSYTNAPLLSDFWYRR